MRPLVPILLVEDNDDDAFLMRRAFKNAEVANPLVTVNDGNAAIAHLARTDSADAPGLVLLDLKLPFKSGFEVLSWIRSQERLRALSVIVLTSSREPSDITRSLAGGANAYVAKPSTSVELADLVRAIRDFWLRFHESTG